MPQSRIKSKLANVIQRIAAKQHRVIPILKDPNLDLKEMFNIFETVINKTDLN